MAYILNFKYSQTPLIRILRGHRKCPYERGVRIKCVELRNWKGFVSPGTKQTLRKNEVSVLKAGFCRRTHVARSVAKILSGILDGRKAREFKFSADPITLKIQNGRQIKQIERCFAEYTSINLFVCNCFLILIKMWGPLVCCNSLSVLSVLCFWPSSYE